MGRVACCDRQATCIQGIQARMWNAHGVDERSDAVQRRLDPWMLGAALAVIPTMIIQTSTEQTAWLRVASVADWVIWAMFVAEAVVMLSVVPDKDAGSGATRWRWSSFFSRSRSFPPHSDRSVSHDFCGSCVCSALSGLPGRCGDCSPLAAFSGQACLVFLCWLAAERSLRRSSPRRTSRHGTASGGRLLPRPQSGMATCIHRRQRGASSRWP